MPSRVGNCPLKSAVQIVGLGRGRRDDPGVLVGAAAPALRHQAAPREKIADGADRGPHHGGMPGCEKIQELARAPVRMLPARGTEELRSDRVNAMRTMVRGPTAVDEPAAPLRVEAFQPLVARLPADAVAGTESATGYRSRRWSAMKAPRCSTGTVSIQGIDPSPREVGRAVREGVSPMFPDNTVTYVSRLVPTGPPNQRIKQTRARWC